MGILTSGIFGPFYNKTGNAIGRMKKNGLNTISALPRITPKAPSELQENNQGKLEQLSKFLSYISPVIDIGFKAYRKKGSSVNAAYSFNFDHAFIEHEHGMLSINYPEMVFSRGDIVGPFGPKVSRIDDSIRFDWPAQKQSQYCQHTDKASFVLIDDIKNKGTLCFMNYITRDELSFTAKLSPDCISHGYHCYVFFSSADGKKTGNSFYAGYIDKIETS